MLDRFRHVLCLIEGLIQDQLHHLRSLVDLPIPRRQMAVQEGKVSVIDLESQSTGTLVLREASHSRFHFAHVQSLDLAQELPLSKQGNETPSHLLTLIKGILVLLVIPSSQRVNIVK